MVAGAIECDAPRAGDEACDETIFNVKGDLFTLMCDSQTNDDACYRVDVTMPTGNAEIQFIGSDPCGNRLEGRSTGPP